ncbi:MAG: hypothetical protein IMZ52_05460, partial [Actinobacteria bacterium]|nr:hypothetical protein [Actinomycetota bacterium]
GIGCISLGFSYPKNIVFHGFTIVGICVLLGVAVKTMDQLIDEIKVKSYRLWIVPLAIFIPTSMAYLALTEEPVIGMVLGTVIGILIAGKLDHPAYVISVILFITLVSIAFVLHIINIEVTTFYIIPVAAAGSFLDEFGHERWKSNKKSITFIFKHRFFLKTFAFFGVIIGFAQPIHFIGFLCFDIFYDLVDTASRYDAVRKKFVPSEFLTGVK